MGGEANERLPRHLGRGDQLQATWLHARRAPHLLGQRRQRPVAGRNFHVGHQHAQMAADRQRQRADPLPKTVIPGAR